MNCIPSRSGKCCNTVSQASSSTLPAPEPQLRATESHGLPLTGHAFIQRASTEVSSVEDARPLAESFVRPTRKILKRIPRASRGLAAKKLSSLLDNVVTYNNSSSWSCILYFAQSCLQVPATRGTKRGRNSSLASVLNFQFRGAALSSPTPMRPTSHHKHRSYKDRDPLEALATKVSTKIEEGNQRGAIQLTCSEDVISNNSDETFAALQAKHPQPYAGSVIPPLENLSELVDDLPVPVQGIAYAIRSFPCHLAGGPDGLMPQHLKDMTGAPAGEEGSVLLSALASFVHFVLKGGVLKEVRLLFFRVNLVPLRKPERWGGVYPIAVGCTLCRLVAKHARSMVREERWENYCHPGSWFTE